MTLHNNELCILFYPPRLNYFITSIGRKQFVNGSVLSFIFLGNISMHLWLVNYSCWVVVTSDKQYFLTGALHWHLAMENLWLTQQLWPQPYPLYLTQQKKHSSLYLFFYNLTLKATLRKLKILNSSVKIMTAYKVILCHQNSLCRHQHVLVKVELVVSRYLDVYWQTRPETPSEEIREDAGKHFRTKQAQNTDEILTQIHSQYCS